jgi:tol-pal system protein YbgF
MRLVAAGAALLLTALPLFAQDRAATLADIRQELSVLSVELRGLRQELSTSGSAMQATASGGPLERLDAIEREVRRLTAKSEELEFRINRVVEDGTNRIGDLEFRLTELEGGDLGQLGATPPLGGKSGLAQPPAPAPSQAVQLAVGEQADFEAAMRLAEAGNQAEALAGLDRFIEAYPRSPLSAEAQLYRGKALTELGNLPQAGRAYLESYTLAEVADPGIAAEALYSLGLTLSALGQTQEACVTLGQVGAVYPGTTAAQNASAALSGLSCS